MASNKVIVPLKGTNVKKGVNYIKTPDGNLAVAADQGAGPGRPRKHDVKVVAMKSIKIIQTISANKREMYMVAVAYFDDQFTAFNEGERVRLRNVCRQIGRKGYNSKRTNYARLLEDCELEYSWLVEAARMTP